MDIASLKTYIYDEDLSEQVLESIGCHHIKKHGNDYVTCGNKDGDNINAIVLYLNENLTVINYTRQLSKTKRTTDLIDLVMFAEDLNFPEAMKFICNCIGIDFYDNDLEDVPESLQIIKLLQGMNSGAELEDNEPLKPISEKILSYYIPCGNSMFEKDNISLEVQQEFHLGYDPQSNRLTIPLYDSLGNLVGIKGRLFKYDLTEYDPPKYLFLKKCNKSKLLYGYYENQNYIKNSQEVYVVESEKGVQQCATYGYRNVVATMGKTISKSQVELLVRLDKKIIMALDQDVKYTELVDIKNMFPEQVPIYYIQDQEHLLQEKESPTDRPEVFEKLKDNICKIV